MALGPGKYGDALLTAQMFAQARSALLIVLDGEHGAGFSCNAPPDVIATIPAILRAVADKIEADLASQKAHE